MCDKALWYVRVILHTEVGSIIAGKVSAVIQNEIAQPLCIYGKKIVLIFNLIIKTLYPSAINVLCQSIQFYSEISSILHNSVIFGLQPYLSGFTCINLIGLFWEKSGFLGSRKFVLKKCCFFSKL